MTRIGVGIRSNPEAEGRGHSAQFSFAERIPVVPETVLRSREVGDPNSRVEGFWGIPSSPSPLREVCLVVLADDASQCVPLQDVEVVAPVIEPHENEDQVFEVGLVAEDLLLPARLIVSNVREPPEGNAPIAALDGLNLDKPRLEVFVDGDDIEIWDVPGKSCDQKTHFVQLQAHSMLAALMRDLSLSAFHEPSLQDVSHRPSSTFGIELLPPV